MSLPRISIVTPCFNAEQFLEETINSVLSQNYPDLQYIIVDGGSKDRSVEIIKKYEKYLDHWISEPDEGQSDAICKGLAFCNGAVFNWLNSDDTYRSNALRTVGEFFLDPATKVLAARSRLFGLGIDRISPGTDIYPGNIERTIGRARIDQPETFMRLKRIVCIGGPKRELHFAMDKELWIRYLICFGLDGIRSSSDVLVNFRYHQTSKTISQRNGFEEEDNILSRTILSLTSRDIDKARINLTDHKPPKLDILKIKEQWCLHRYEIAYAQRNWDRMNYWRRLVLEYQTSFTTLQTLLNLEIRRSIFCLSSNLSIYTA